MNIESKKHCIVENVAVDANASMSGLSLPEESNAELLRNLQRQVVLHTNV